MVFDRDTGKPKGYGFCTFPDAETAASAVRNLNNYDVGGRQLRVDYADNSDDTDAPKQRIPPARNPPAASQSAYGNAPMQQVQAPVASQASTDGIQTTMSAMSPQQLLEYLSYLKVCIQKL